MVDAAYDTGSLVSEIVDAKVDLAALDADTLTWFARVGLIREAGDRLHVDRGGPDMLSENDTAPGPAPGPSGRNPRAWLYLHHVKLEINGALKRLIDFTVEDVDAFTRDAVRYRRAWEARVEFGIAAMKKLTARRKNKISQLPQKDQEELEALASEAWSR